ncbi:hypothetical protein J5X84_05690 [Streptosporangiaceae bacterium NEAU-GS5]|nr:hypothetical protein [Streptosporangiaceae bacterium NEAU-GS5]
MAVPVVELPERPREIHRRRALIFLDQDDAGPGRALAAALSARGYAVEISPDPLSGFPEAGENELLVIRVPGDVRPDLAGFVPRLDERNTAAVVMIADFGWIATPDLADADPLTTRLGVRGDPPVDAALLTTSLRVGDGHARSGPTLTEAVTRILNAGDAPITVGALRDAVDAELTATTRRCYLSLHRMGALIRLADARAVPADLPLTDALRELAARGTAAPADAAGVVAVVHDAYASGPARDLLRRVSLLRDGEAVTPEVARLLGAEAGLGELVAPWGLLDAAGRPAHPAVKDFGAVRLSAAELETYEPALREWRAGRRPARPRARLTADRWTLDDRLGHQVYAEAVAAFIRHPETRPPLTIGITGPWGTGKTSLMRMIQDNLDPGGSRDGEGRGAVTNAEVLGRVRRPGEPVAPLEDRSPGWRPTVWFNPWMYQSGEQVWAGLAHEIITQVTARLPVVERERFWLRLNLARVDREAVRRRAYRTILTRLLPVAIGLIAVAMVATASFALPLLRDVAGTLGSAGALAVLGAAAVRVGRFLREPADAAFGTLVRPPDLLVPDLGYGGKTGLLHLVQTDMRHVLDLVASEERPLVVFVDDLDRCSSATVAQVIEAINLFLAGDFPDCVFVLAMEPDVVAAHVEVAYRELAGILPAGQGAGLGRRFLEKIVQLPLSVPRLEDGPALSGYVRALLEVPEGAAERPSADLDPDDDAATTVEEELRRRAPTIASLDRIARQLQTESTGRSGEALAPHLRLAAERVYDELYTDRKAYEAISALLPALTQPNPREIKRYVNVFRFYSFVTFNRSLAGAGRATDSEVAKLAMLAIRWPHLLSAFVREWQGRTVLACLEDAARSDEKAWQAAQSATGVAADDALRSLLGAGPSVASLAADLL